LVLNAIQMLELHKKWLKSISKQTTRPVPLFEEGMVVVQTKYIVEDKDFPVEVRIIDCGPGIHRSNWDQIFMQGYSGRGGAGLGLHISRSLIERMGGRLLLLDSVLFVGSAFVIKLPASYEEAQNGKN
jgi:signal transduction histidine kinase